MTMINKARLASELGLGAGGGALEKLAITYRDGAGVSQKVEALFNPGEISISRSVSYEQKRVASKAEAVELQQRLRSVEPATLSIELFFDTYEARSDVRKRTDQVALLATPDRETHRPPVCHLGWGHFDIFDGVLTNLDQRFTMFLSDGTPVRATLSCSFVESSSDARSRAGEMHSADVDKARVVQRNDTLQSIAAEVYDDPGLWRPIATANGIVNPRVLQPGTALMIPRLRS